MAKKLTKKEKGFVKDYINTGNGTQAILKNYNTKDEDVAGVMAVQNLGKLKIQEAILDKLGDDILEEKHSQLLNAISLEKIKFDERDSDEVIEHVIDQMQGYELLHIVENKTREGEVYEKYAYVKAPDNMTQDKALDKAYKIKGRYAPEKMAIPTDTKTYNFYFDPKFQQNIKQYEDNLKQQILNAQTNQTITQDVEIIE